MTGAAVSSRQESEVQRSGVMDERLLDFRLATEDYNNSTRLLTPDF